MKSLMISLLMAAGLTVPALAADIQAMVLASQGKATVSSNGKSADLRTGMVLVAGSQIKLAAGGQVTLILMPKGERFQAAGPAVLELAANGLKAVSGELKSTTGPSVALVPTGKNMRHMGGAALRAEAEQVETPFQNVTIRNLPGERPGLRITFFSSTDDRVDVAVSEGYSLRGWQKTTTGELKPVQDGKDFDGMSTPVIGEAQGEPAGDPASKLFRYTLDVPLAKASTQQLRVCIGAPIKKKDLLITRARLIGPADEEKLEQSATAYREWAAREPASAEPWVLLMALYDDYDRVDEALAAGEQALTRAPKDLGIMLAVSRLTLEAGKIQKARTLFEAVVRENGLSVK